MSWVLIPATLLSVVLSPARTSSAAELYASGPVGCADVSELGFRVERALGMALSKAAALSFQVHVEPAGHGYAARIQMTDLALGGLASERVVSAPDCGKLANAISVVVTLALSAQADAAAAGLHVDGATPSALEPPGSAASASAERADAAAGDAALAGDDPAASPSEAPISADASLWLVADVGSLPSAGAGLGVSLELGGDRFRLRALGTVLLDQHTELGGGMAPAPGADLGLIAAAVLACTTPIGTFSSPLSGQACAGWEVGRLSGVGTGVAEPQQGGVLWSAPRVDVGLFWAIPGTRLRWGPLLTAAVPLRRDEFVLRDLGRVHRLPSLVGRVALGATFSF